VTLHFFTQFFAVKTPCKTFLRAEMSYRKIRTSLVFKGNTHFHFKIRVLSPVLAMFCRGVFLYTKTFYRVQNDEDFVVLFGYVHLEEAFKVGEQFVVEYWGWE
jgi:hypothetical protein